MPWKISGKKKKKFSWENIKKTKKSSLKIFKIKKPWKTLKVQILKILKKNPRENE